MKDLITAALILTGALCWVFGAALFIALAARDIAALARRRGRAPREPADRLGPLCEDLDEPPGPAPAECGLCEDLTTTGNPGDCVCTVPCERTWCTARRRARR